jgi:uncharacterized membrane protein YhaH (DUF805 family)
MKWIRFFASLDGRIGRKTFWLTSLTVVAVELVAIFIGVLLMVAIRMADLGLKPMLHEAAVLVLVAFAYPKFVIDVKRGHDRNIPMWIVGAVYAAAIARSLLIELGLLVDLPDQNVMSMINVASFLAVMAVGIAGLALLIELGFRKGTLGPNRYGPAPLTKLES